MELPTGFVRLNRYVMGGAIVHIIMVQYNTYDSQNTELHQFRAHASPLCILAKVKLYTYLKY